VPLRDLFCFFFQAEDGIRDATVTGVQTCALPISRTSTSRAGWAVGFDDREVEVLGREEVDGAARQRGAALVQLASVDGRAHTARDPAGTFVAVGDFPFGAGLLLTQSDATAEQAAAVTEELRRIVAG